MKEKKRWGRKFKDDRDWVSYNENLVLRGTFLLEMDWVESWDKELEEMNKNKVGAKYQYPESLIKLQAVWYQWIDYRGIEGIMRKLVEFSELPQANDYSTINRRINKLDVDFQLPKDNNIEISCDSTGMKFEHSGDYRTKMYGKRKIYIKVALTADAKNRKVIDINVSLEGTNLSEPELAEWSMRSLMHRGYGIDKFFGDGAFDKIELFKFLEENDIEPAIKIRKTAVFGDNELRNKELKEYKKRGYKKWAREKKYGYRWPATEGIFSAVKRKCGEHLRSHNVWNAMNEARRKFWAYEIMKEYAESRT